jgi:hypothetical protein
MQGTARGPKLHGSGLAAVAACISLACGLDDSGAGPGAGGSAGETDAGVDSSGGSAGSTGDGPSPTLLDEFAELPAVAAGIAFGKNPAGAAVLFVSLPSQDRIVTVNADGTIGPLASVPEPRGLALAGDGSLLAAGKSSDSSEAVVWLVKSDGTATVHATGAPAQFADLDSVAIAPDDRPSLSDPTSGNVYRVDADGSNPSIVTSLIAQPTALAFAAGGTTLYVTSSGTGALWGVPRSASVGNYGPPEELAGAVPDASALIVMAAGDLVLVSETQGVLRLEPDGSERTTVLEGSSLENPAGAAFGVGEFGNTELYLADGSRIARLSFDDPAVDLPVR